MVFFALFQAKLILSSVHLLSKNTTIQAMLKKLSQPRTERLRSNKK